jgi:ATP-dependent RNA helicase SUPV3L1/SUV3
MILSGRGVTAVLGPTNTGKTHLAIERMVAHSSGVIGLPLRLLAREVFNRVVEKVGAANVALVTGEEKIQPPGARYSVCTVEAMPRETKAAFVAIDEVQLANDLERGHIFTDRILQPARPRRNAAAGRWHHARHSPADPARHFGGQPRRACRISPMPARRR